MFRFTAFSFSKKIVLVQQSIIVYYKLSKVVSLQQFSDRYIYYKDTRRFLQMEMPDCNYRYFSTLVHFPYIMLIF